MVKLTLSSILIAILIANIACSKPDYKKGNRNKNQKKSPCRKEFYYHKGSCYLLPHHQSSWRAAHQYCLDRKASLFNLVDQVSYLKKWQSIHDKFHLQRTYHVGVKSMYIRSNWTILGDYGSYSSKPTLYSSSRINTFHPYENAKYLPNHGSWWQNCVASPEEDPYNLVKACTKLEDYQLINIDCENELAHFLCEYEVSKFDEFDKKFEKYEDDICPSGLVGYKGNCLFISQIPNTWDVARQHCQSMSGDLLKLDGEFFVDEWYDLYTSFGLSGEYHIGMYYTNRWKWSLDSERVNDATLNMIFCNKVDKFEHTKTCLKASQHNYPLVDCRHDKQKYICRITNYSRKEMIKPDQYAQVDFVSQAPLPMVQPVNYIDPTAGDQSINFDADGNYVYADLQTTIGPSELLIAEAQAAEMTGGNLEIYPGKINPVENYAAGNNQNQPLESYPDGQFDPFADPSAADFVPGPDAMDPTIITKPPVNNNPANPANNNVNPQYYPPVQNNNNANPKNYPPIEYINNAYPQYPPMPIPVPNPIQNPVDPANPNVIPYYIPIPFYPNYPGAPPAPQNGAPYYPPYPYYPLPQNYPVNPGALPVPNYPLPAPAPYYPPPVPSVNNPVQAVNNIYYQPAPPTIAPTVAPTVAPTIPPTEVPVAFTEVFVPPVFFGFESFPGGVAPPVVNGNHGNEGKVTINPLEYVPSAADLNFNAGNVGAICKNANDCTYGLECVRLTKDEPGKCTNPNTLVLNCPAGTVRAIENNECDIGAAKGDHCEYDFECQSGLLCIEDEKYPTATCLVNTSIYPVKCDQYHIRDPSNVCVKKTPVHQKCMYDQECATGVCLFNLEYQADVCV